MKIPEPATVSARGAPGPVCFGGQFVLDATERRLTQNGRPVTIQPKTLDLIICLVQNAGNLIHRDTLIALLWPGVVVTDASLARCVKQARQALGDDAANPRYIETVPKAGYRLIAPVTPLESQRGGRPWVPWAALAGLAVMASAWWFSGSDTGDASIGPAPAPTGQPALDVRAISADRAFRDGMHALGLRSTESLREARDRFEKALEEDPRHAGALSGLAMTLVLSAYRPPDPEIRRQALALAEQALSIDPQQDLGYVAIGMAHYYQPQQDDRAEQAYRRALELDPESEEAFRGLATLLTSEGRIDEAIALQRQGLAMNPWHTTLAGNLAITLGKKGRYEEALELLQSLGEVPEARPALIYPMVSILTIRGEKARAVQVLLEGIEETPSLWGPMALGQRLADIGDIDTARLILQGIRNTCESDETRFLREASLREALGPEDWPTEPFPLPSDESLGNGDLVLRWLGRFAMLRGDAFATVEALQVRFPSAADVRGWQGSFVDPADDAQALAWALIEVGRQTEAEAYLERIQGEIVRRRAAGYRSYYPHTVLEARNAAMRGDSSRALGLMEQAVREGWLSLWQFHGDPRWRAVADTPRFRVLAEDLATRATRVRRDIRAMDLQSRLLRLIELHGTQMPECATLG